MKDTVFNECTDSGTRLCTDCQLQKDDNRCLCLKTEADFLASLLRLQQSEQGKRNLHGYGEGQLIEWFLYAKRSFESYASSDLFGWGLKLLDELAKVVFEVGQVTSKLKSDEHYRLITTPEAKLFSNRNKPEYAQLVEALDVRILSINGAEALNHARECYSDELEVRVGFTKLKDTCIRCFSWDHYSADVYLICWDENGKRTSGTNTRHALLDLAMAYLHGVARFGVTPNTVRRTHHNGYLLAQVQPEAV